MSKPVSPDDLVAALGSLKPEPDEITNAWYIGRRERTLQQVLTRATQEPRVDPGPARVVAPKWRRRRRAILAGALAIVGLGSGLAWAYTTGFAGWYTAGALDGITCMTSWAEPGDDSRADEQYGGSQLTTDPVADCHNYADLTGKPRIVDPVAVHYRDWLVVGPRAGMPADAVPITAPEDARVFELERSLDDLVDGGMSRCLDEASGMQFARAELDRLGLTSWTVTTREQDPPAGDCAMLFVSESGVVEVRTHHGSNPADMSSTPVSVLRSQIAGQCLSLSDAEAVVNDALGSAHHWPISTQLDPAAACTRVDLPVGGSLQVFLYGPETANPALQSTPTPVATGSVRPSEPRTVEPASPISALLQAREENRRVIHDAAEIGIAACMVERGFSYEDRTVDWEGLTQRQIDEWLLALQGEPILPEGVLGPDPIADPTILVARGPESAFYFRSDACTTIGRSAVYGDIVEWFVLEQTIDHLADQAADEADGNAERRATIETRLATENEPVVKRFAQLQDDAIARAQRMLSEGR